MPVTAARALWPAQLTHNIAHLYLLRLVLGLFVHLTQKAPSS